MKGAWILILLAGLADIRAEDVKTKLSTLWTVESLNIIGADVLTSFLPESQEELEKFAGGKEKVKHYMLAGALIYEIPISMIFLSRYLPTTANRWTNVAAAAITGFLLVGGGSGQPHYIALAVVQVATLSYIGYLAFQLEDEKDAGSGTPHPLEKPGLGIRVDPREGLMGLRYTQGF